MNKATNEALRAQYIELLTKLLTDSGEEVLRVKSNEIALPVVDRDGDDHVVVLAVPVYHGDGNLVGLDTEYLLAGAGEKIGDDVDVLCAECFVSCLVHSFVLYFLF